MTRPLETIVSDVRLGETIQVDLFRARPEGGYYAPLPLDVVDLIPTVGRTHIAQRITGDGTVSSKMAYMAVGTGTAAGSLGSTNIAGEVARKALAVFSATNNLITATATFGGAADTVTSVQIGQAALFNHAGSGNGTMMQIVNFATVTLADSDFLSATLQTNIGSS